MLHGNKREDAVWMYKETIDVTSPITMRIINMSKEILNGKRRTWNRD